MFGAFQQNQTSEFTTETEIYAVLLVFSSLLLCELVSQCQNALQNESLLILDLPFDFSHTLTQQLAALRTKLLPLHSAL